MSKRKKVRLTLADLKKGEEAVIESFSDEEMSLKLMEMGCLPGEKVRVERIAPFGDPIAISVSGYMLSMRKDEAATINIQMTN
jgi:ferrous iron transport protein A